MIDKESIQRNKKKTTRNPTVIALTLITLTYLIYFITQSIIAIPLGLIATSGVFVFVKFQAMNNWCKEVKTQSDNIEQFKEKAKKENLIWPMILESHFPNNYEIEVDEEIKESRIIDGDNNESVKQNIAYKNQIETFKSLGYEYDKDVTKEMIINDVYEMSWEDQTEDHIEKNPYSILYYTFGWRSSKVNNYNYSDKCLWFDLEFFDSSSQYKWFMERLGAITSGEIIFKEISIELDSENIEWISFKVNGLQKKWKLERSGYIADHFVQRFSYLPTELKTKGRYTYYDNGGQQWVIDYATVEEQNEFIKTTGLKREWLGEGNQFSEPPKD